MVVSVQVVGIGFVLVMLYLTFLYYKRNNYSKGSFTFWMVLWGLALVLLVIPNTFTSVIEKLNIARVTDLYVTLAIMFFSAVTFLNFVNVQRQERKMEELVRKVALLKPKRK